MNYSVRLSARTTALVMFASIHVFISLQALAQLEPTAPVEDARERLSDKGVRFENVPLRSLPLGQTRPEAPLLAVIDEEWQGSLEELDELRFVPKLQSVRLRGKRFTDQHLEAIAKCKTIQELILIETGIGDAGIERLAPLTELRKLIIRYTPITSKSVPTICDLKKLATLQLIGTDVPRSKKEQLVAQLPDIVFLDIRSGAFLGISEAIPRERRFISSTCEINRPEPGSAAEKAGLIQGDVITRVDDKDIDSFVDLKAAISECEHGQSLRVTFDRDGKTITKDVKLEKWPNYR